MHDYIQDVDKLVRTQGYASVCCGGHKAYELVILGRHIVDQRPCMNLDAQTVETHRRGTFLCSCRSLCLHVCVCARV